MNFTFNHNNLNVRDLEKSLAFYKEALGLDVVRERAGGGRKLYSLAYLERQQDFYSPARTDMAS